MTERQWRTIDAIRKINGCGEGKPWGERCTMYPSKGGTPVVTYIHSGDHLLPDEVPPVIVKFFKQYAGEVTIGRASTEKLNHWI